MATLKALTCAAGKRDPLKALKHMMSHARDVVLPPLCLSCDNAVGKQGGVCATCWGELRFIERPYCDVMGAPFSYELGQGALSAEAIANPPPFDKARSVVLYDDVARRLVQGLKFSDRTDLAPWMAKWMVRSGHEILQESPVLVPVPLHRRRLFSRRFNQSAELARAVASQANLRYLPEVLIRSRSTRQQVGLGTKERFKNVRGAFRIPSELEIHVKSQTIVLVDDVYTTGATLKACARALRRKGAARIHCLTFARVANGVAVNEV